MALRGNGIDTISKQKATRRLRRSLNEITIIKEAKTHQRLKPQRLKRKCNSNDNIMKHVAITWLKPRRMQQRRRREQHNNSKLEKPAETRKRRRL